MAASISLESAEKRRLPLRDGAIIGRMLCSRGLACPIPPMAVPAGGILGPSEGICKISPKAAHAAIAIAAPHSLRSLAQHSRQKIEQK
jgi:hypothetical protein